MQRGPDAATAASVSTAPTARFWKLTEALSPPEWRLLGLVAAEPDVPQSALEKALPNGPKTSADFIEQGLRRGLLLEAGSIRRPVLGRGWLSEATFSMTPSFRVLTLRHLGGQGVLHELRSLANRVMPTVTESWFSIPLFMGDLAGLQHAGYQLNLAGADEPQVARHKALLRHALSSPFDAAWLSHTWGSDAITLAAQALVDALHEPAEVGEVYEWLLTHHSETPGCRKLLLQHALLRSDLDRALALLAGKNDWEFAPLAAALAYLQGDLMGARAALDHSLKLKPPKSAHTSSEKVPDAGALAPLLALVMASRDGQAARRVAKRLVSGGPPLELQLWCSPLGIQKASSALRSLLANLLKPEGRRTRRDVHQLSTAAPAWELLLRALDVHLHEPSKLVRHGWARRLDSSSTQWEALGYRWLARQAAFLAQALAPPGTVTSEPPRSRELALCDLLAAVPEWQKAITALESFVQSSEKRELPTQKRVAWYVNMLEGRLARPALEEFRPGSGWTQTRVALHDLGEWVEHLPPEDAHVVRGLSVQGSQDPRVDALDRLVGHPRVYNGARGRLPVEVVRGECRVETRTERGQLVVAVEPANASEGVNVVVESESRMQVLKVDKNMARLIGLLPSPLSVPVQHADQLLPILGQLAEQVPVDCAQLSAHERLPPSSKPCLRVSPVSGAFAVELGVRPFAAEGRFFPPGIGHGQLMLHRDGQLLSTVRNLDRERERCARLLSDSPTLTSASLRDAEERGVPHTEPQWRWILGEEDLFLLLSELRGLAVECDLEWQNQRPIRARGQLKLGQLKGKLRPIKGWYLATGGVNFEDSEQFNLAQLVQMPFTRSGRFLRLPSGDFAEVERRVRRVLRALQAATAGVHKDALKVSPLAVDALSVLASPEAGFDVDPRIGDWLARVERLHREHPPAPQGLSAELRDYQLQGYRWLWRLGELGLGACLADDMGLGKTLQTIALLLARSATGPTLVVAPTSVCANWLAEFARFAPGLHVAEYAGKQRQRLLEADAAQTRVLVTSYALLQQDVHALEQVDWHTLVLDEAQFIKNPHAARAKAAFRLRAACRVALTGTPVENHLGDLWSIFRFLNPSLLGGYKQFFHRFLRPIERDQDLERKQELQGLLRPFLLRREKAQVASELPPLTVVRHDVEHSADEALRYALLKKQIHERLRTAAGKRDHKLEVLAEITRLRRFCCHPRLVFPDADQHSSKVETLLELVEELRDNGHRALVFSQFVDFLSLIREQLDERQIPYQYLDGSTPRARRTAAVTAFQAGSGDLFLISLKAGGFGLNLAAADYVIQLDPWWNPAVEAQATDRAHRIGQERPVTVYRLVTRNSIEERIEDLQRGKRSLARDVLDNSDTPVRLSQTQLVELLG